MWRRNRVKVQAPKEPTLRDVHVSARLAATHAAGGHAMLSTILHELAQHRALLDQLVTAAKPTEPPCQTPWPPGTPGVVTYRITPGGTDGQE
jgi:hypothetical protein